MTSTAVAGSYGPEVHRVTLGDVLAGHTRHFPSGPDHPAVVCGDDRYDYGELEARVLRLASAFGSAGVEKGERVLWLGQNCHRLLEGLLACAAAGCVFSPANWRQSAEELAFVLEDADPAVVIWQADEIGDVVTEARTRWEGSGNGHAKSAIWLQHDSDAREGTYEGFLAGGSIDDAPGAVSDGTAALMLYTAAFTGKPNGALLSHRALVTQGALLGPLQGIGPDYVYLNCGPLFHVATLMTTLATFVVGGTNVFVRRVEAEELCRLIETERCTGAFVMPPTIDQILELNADGRFDLHTLRSFGGKPAWNDMITVDDSPWGRHPGGYGQTEVMGLASLPALGPAIGSHGRPAPFLRVAILDPDGAEAAQGETGEICVRGATVMNGYHDRSELNVERGRGGYHHTGDLGRIEADGSLSFVAPLGRLIKSAAENIYPTEVEACLRSHPAVADVGVIGVPDRTWGQNVKAIVVLKAESSATADELIEHCRSRIASYKKPKTVEFVDALPRQGFAVDYDELDGRFGGGGYPGTGA